MVCWICGKESSGICNFCGRALCKEHQQTKPYILAAYDEAGDDPHVFSVQGALWCGQCEPMPTPIRLPEIE